MSDVAELLARVKAATGEEDVSLSVAILEALDVASYITDDGDPVTSIDAALALVERMLPGWRWLVGNEDDLSGESCACTLKPPEHSDWNIEGDAITPPLAILAALLTALSHPDPTT